MVTFLFQIREWQRQLLLVKYKIANTDHFAWRRRLLVVLYTGILQYVWIEWYKQVPSNFELDRAICCIHESALPYHTLISYIPMHQSEIVLCCLGHSETDKVGDGLIMWLQCCKLMDAVHACNGGGWDWMDDVLTCIVVHLVGNCLHATEEGLLFLLFVEETFIWFIAWWYSTYWGVNIGGGIAQVLPNIGR